MGTTKCWVHDSSKKVFIRFLPITAKIKYHDGGYTVQGKPILTHPSGSIERSRIRLEKARILFSIGIGRVVISPS